MKSSELHREETERVRALLGGDDEVTRSAVNVVRAESALPAQAPTHRRAQPSLLAHAVAACAQLELALDRVARTAPRIEDADLESLRQRVASLGDRLA
jgi:predicted component of type VI protein secretion system